MTKAGYDEVPPWRGARRGSSAGGPKPWTSRMQGRAVAARPVGTLLPANRRDARGSLTFPPGAIAGETCETHAGVSDLKSHRGVARSRRPPGDSDRRKSEEGGWAGQETAVSTSIREITWACLHVRFK